MASGSSFHRFHQYSRWYRHIPTAHTRTVRCHKDRFHSLSCKTMNCSLAHQTCQCTDGLRHSDLLDGSRRCDYCSEIDQTCRVYSHARPHHYDNPMHHCKSGWVSSNSVRKWNCMTFDLRYRVP